MATCVRQLSPDIIQKLRTGINLTSISHCVEELVLNSIDAGANCIAIHLNLPIYQIQVIDNGNGIDIEQMKMVGNRYATSKCHSLQDLKNLKRCGFRGEALSSLKEVCSLLMIESRSALSKNTYCKIFTQGNALDPQKSLNSRPSKGTTVSVYDFMYNMPVRRNSFSATLDFEESRKLVQSVALMHPNVSFTLKNEATGEVCLQLRKCNSLYHSFFQIFGKKKSDNLREVNFQKGSYKISGCISTECNVSKDLQFLYVNKRLILHTKLHKLINSVLNKALCSKHKLRLDTKKLTPDGYSPTKGQAQYCIFVLNISCGYDKYDIIFEPRKTIIEFLEWDEVIKLVEDCLIDLLKRENLFCITEERTAVPVDATVENTNLSKIDTHDCKQALFSHVVRRLQKDSEVEVVKTLASGNPDNISKSNSIDTLEAISNGSSFVCFSSKCPDESALDRLKVCSKAPAPNFRHPIPVNMSSTFQNDLNTSQSIPLNKSIFPTKSPVMLNIPVRSTLSELQKGSSSLDLLSKLKDKFQFSPVKRSFLPKNKTKPDFELEKDINDITVMKNKAPQHVLSLTNRNKNEYNVPKNVSSVANTDNVLRSTKDKSFQCPSISIDILKCTQLSNKNISSSEASVKKTVKDKSFQCPSVSYSNEKRIVSRFDFGKERSETPLNFLPNKRSRKLPCSSKNLIKNCINTVENLLNDTSNKMNHSVCPSKTFLQQQKIVHFDIDLDSHATDVSNKDSDFNMALDLNYTNAGLSEQGIMKQSENIKTITSSIGDNFFGSSVLKTFYDWQRKGILTDTESVGLGSSPYLENEDFLSNSYSYENTITEPIPLEEIWFMNSPTDTKSKRCIEDTKSDLSCVGEFNEYIPIRGLNYNVAENYSCISSNEACDIRTKIPSKRSYPFEYKKYYSHYKNTDLSLNLNTDTITLESDSPELRNDIIEGNLTPENSIYSADINYSLNQNNKNVASDVMATMNELVSIAEEVNSVESDDDSIKNTSYVLLESNNGRGLGQLEQNSLIGSMSPKSGEVVERIPTVAKNPYHCPNNLQDVPEKSDNLINSNSGELFIQSSFSELSKSHDPTPLESYCNDLIVGTSDTNIKNHVTFKANSRFSPLTSDILAVNVNANVESLSKSNASDGEIKGSNKNEEIMNLELCCMSLEEPFSELAGMEQKSTSCVQGSGKFSEVLGKESGHQDVLHVSDKHDSNIVDWNVNGLTSNLKSSFNKHSNFSNMNKSITENSKLEHNQSCWEARFEPTTRKTVYIDIKTGNSTYAPPVVAEMSGDNLTSSSQTGVTLKSHFFLTHDYSPFVSKTQTPKVEGVCNGLKDNLKNFLKNQEIQEQSKKWRIDEDQIENDSDIEFLTLFNKWENPVFEIPYEVDKVGDSNTLQSLPQMYTFLNSYKFSKDTLKSLKVIGQVDCKFIACVLKDFNKGSQDKRLLALFDQHAVHERVRLEEIMEDLYQRCPNGSRLVKSESIFPTLRIFLDYEEIRLLQTYHENLHQIGIKLKIDDSQTCSVYSVPACLVQRTTKDFRRSQADTIIILQNTISEWLSSVVKTRSIPQALPKTLTSVVNYQACRGAVKFGDPLTLEQCCALLESLSKCKLPFQCAHGRPSIAPILDLNKIESLGKKKSQSQIWKLSALSKDNT